MFNKHFTDTQLDADSVVKALSATSKTATTEFIVDIEDAYMERYFLPRIFLKRNFETAKKFLLSMNGSVFESYSAYDFLRQCDLSDFILEVKDNVDEYPSLFSRAMDYKMSDEAAWVLLENSSYSPSGYIKFKSSIFHSVWFREFEHEDKNDSNFLARINNAINLHSSFVVSQNIEDPELVENIILYYELVRSYHTGSPMTPTLVNFLTDRASFAFNNASLRSKHFINWLLEFLPVEALIKINVVVPYVLYAPDIPVHLRNKFYDEALVVMPKLVTGLHGLFKRGIKHWRQLIGEEGYEKLKVEYFPKPGQLDTFVLPEEMWNPYDEDAILLMLELYKRTDKKVVDENHFRALKNYIRHLLEQEFGVKTSFNGLNQLMSIYTNTRV